MPDGRSGVEIEELLDSDSIDIDELLDTDELDIDALLDTGDDIEELLDEGVDRGDD